ncbi:MAG: thioredoxin family protein [Bacteroidales bacterium]|nr:thioredoxin family protein [Bacteroidales bacterium]
MNRINHWLLTIVFVAVTGMAFAQLSNPVKWACAVKDNPNNTATITITAHVDNGWHLYSQHNTLGLTQPTVFTYSPSKDYQLIGKTTEPAYVEQTNEFGTDRFFDSPVVVFTQKVKNLTNKNIVISIEIDAQACTEGKCVLAGASLSANIKGIALTDTNTIDIVTIDTIGKQTQNTDTNENTALLSSNETSSAPPLHEKSMMAVFWISFLAGLLALITPCVFPMIPMTISFFMKEKNGQQGLKKSLFFGGSIIFIFAVLGLLLTLLLGKDAMYIISTHWIPNLLFFVIFMIFAFSFFGLFEISLPSSWTNKSDKKSEKGGYGGAFFVALTTVLVSFSCTGPILGAALIEMSSGTSNSMVFFISMLGFAIGFALPFALLALFPSVLKKIKSGSWLNAVKIVFGFLEIALGLKFLSMADLSAGWGILDRETFLALWIVIFSLLGFYLLGKLRFKGDEKLEHIGIVRLFLAIITFSFVVYMLPGLFGAPLKAISGYIPPKTTQDFDMEKLILKHQASASVAEQLPKNRKYADELHFPVGFDGFFDLEEAKAYAKKVNKPIFIDFTGKTCANCREMETYVWTNPQIMDLLKNKFVMVALYADVNTIELDEKDWQTLADGTIIKTLGKKNLHYQMTNYKMNAQPYYVLIDAEGNKLTKEPKAYDRNIDNFLQFLQEGLSNFYKN